RTAAQEWEPVAEPWRSTMGRSSIIGDPDFGVAPGGTAGSAGQSVFRDTGPQPSTVARGNRKPIFLVREFGDGARPPGTLTEPGLRNLRTQPLREACIDLD